MPAYNFKKQFAPQVESGDKTCTIRATDKGAKVGDTAYLYYGQRTKQCRKLGEGTITGVWPITIWLTSLGKPLAEIQYPEMFKPMLYFGYHIDNLAKQDGFQDADEMVSFFAKQYGLPFNGFLHKWTLNKP